MWLYLFLTIVVTVISFPINNNKRKQFLLRFGNNLIITRNIRYDICFFLVFMILAFFSAARYGIGVDYNGYLGHIKLIQNGNHHYMEIGFKTIVKFFQKYTKDAKIVISFCGIITVFFFVKAIWEQSDRIAESVFLFLSWGYYFLTYNTVRNYLALSIVLFAIKYLVQERKILFILWVLFASCFHKSALISIPIYCICNNHWKKYHYLIIIMITIVALFLRNPLRSLAFYFYPEYEGSVYDTGRVSYLNVLKGCFVIFICLLSYKNVENDRLNRLYFNLNVCSLCFYIGMYWVPEISRIGFYMNTTSIMLLPRVLNRLKNEKSCYLVKCFVYIISVCLLVLLCKNFYDDTIQLLPYKSWLF